MRTLQTLGSVPDWESGKPLGESDDDEDASFTPIKTKKKRCKKRKRSSNADKKVDENGQPDPSETPVKKKKPMKMTKKEPSENMRFNSFLKNVSDCSYETHLFAGPKVSQESSKDENDKGVSEEKQGSQTAQKLSRKQWKNKMKNKRHCKNKYLQKTTGVDNAEAKEEPVSQPGDVPATQKGQKNPTSSKKRKKSKVQNGISECQDDAEESSTNTDHLQSETQTAGDCISSNKISHEVGHKEKPNKMNKKAQILAEKLRKTLKSHLADDSNGDKDEKEENDNKTVNVKGDAQQTPPDRSTALRLKMERRLEAARFRYINELLYTSTSGEAKRMFQQDPDAIGIYHRGYTAQVQHWPENPVDSIISYIRQK